MGSLPPRDLFAHPPELVRGFGVRAGDGSNGWFLEWAVDDGHVPGERLLAVAAEAEGWVAAIIHDGALGVTAAKAASRIIRGHRVAPVASRTAGVSPPAVRYSMLNFTMSGHPIPVNPCRELPFDELVVRDESALGEG